METTTNDQHKEQARPHKPRSWHKILSLLTKYGEPLCNVEEATGHKHDPREWSD